MPSGGHGHCIEPRTENEYVRFFNVRTDAGPMRTGRPVGALRRTTRRIIYLRSRPASIRPQCLQPRALLDVYEERHRVGACHEAMRDTIVAEAVIKPSLR